MTATEFAEKINTPYPTVAAWLREGRVPGAQLQQFGNVKFWMIPADVLKDFTRPKKGRPKKDVETSATRLLFEPAATAKPSRKARTKKTGVKKASKKISPKK